ncbi:MAG: glycoside hydrolase superfamily [Podila humilis]|nr:MAG: glycoside hydrolase superfamily [Podila humilis]
MVSSRLFVWGLVLVILLILLPTPGETRSKDKSRQKHVKHRDREEREMREHHHHQPQAQLRYNDELKKKKKKEQHLQPPQNQKQKQKQKLKHGSDTKKHNAKDKNMKKNHQKPKKDKDKKKKKKIKDGMEHDFAVDVHCGADGEACPDSLPCCSQWGFCGVGPLYCGQGCQGQFGQCGEDATVNDGPGEADNVGDGKHRNKNNRGGKKKHHPHGKSHGFDLQDRIRGSNSQEGLALRIPASVPKLPPNDTLVNIAYFPGWTQYRGQGRNNCHQRPYIPSAIPWSSLDYVMFAFVYFDEDNELYPADPSDEDLYFTINRLKQPTQTRVMISIGGWSFTHPDSQRDEGMQHRFETMMLSASSRTQFIESCIEFVKFYGFDGVDIDYEYPTFHEREYVTLLFQEMRKAFDAEGSGLVLSLAGASFAEGVQGFELDKIAEAVDFMMIMAYDLYGAYDSTKLVNIHTTLFQMPTENHGGHSVQGAVELYLDHGVPREKIVLGLALYGKTFLLTDSHNTAPGRAPFKAGGDPSSCIETRGDIAYNEIAPLIHSGNPTQPIWDEDSKAFYFVYGKHHNNWVGYDDRPSLDLKLQMAVELDLAGVMWWSLDQDLDATSQDLAHPIQKRSEEGVGEVRRRAIPQVPFHPPAAPPKTYLPKAPDENRQGDTALQETESCPAIASPPEDLANISTDLLGKPGLVPYVASKRKRCPVVVEYPHVLPAAPVGNIVMTKCNAPADLSCPESWQAFVCQADGWSEASPCYEEEEARPSQAEQPDWVETASVYQQSSEDAAAKAAPEIDPGKENEEAGEG